MLNFTNLWSKLTNKKEQEENAKSNNTGLGKKR